MGLKPERLIDSEGRIDAFLEPPTQEQTETLVEAVRSGAEAGGHVVAIMPQWLKGDGLLRLQMVQSALDDEHLTIHETPLPPLAAAVLASLASAVAPHLPSRGVLVSLLPELEAELHVFTWLGSVSGLSVPAPDARPAHGLAQPGQRVRRLVLSRAVGAEAGPRRRRHPAAADRAPVAPGRQRPRRQRRLDPDRQRRARRPRGADGRADAQRADAGGAPASWSRASPTRSTCSGSRTSSSRPPTRGRVAGAASRSPARRARCAAIAAVRRAARAALLRRGSSGRSTRRPHVSRGIARRPRRRRRARRARGRSRSSGRTGAARRAGSWPA